MDRQSFTSKKTAISSDMLLWIPRIHLATGVIEYVLLSYNRQNSLWNPSICTDTTCRAFRLKKGVRYKHEPCKVYPKKDYDRLECPFEDSLESSGLIL